MKSVQQIDLKLGNEPGTLSKVTDLLSANGINIVAFYVVTEENEGILHFVPNDPSKAVKILQTAGYRLEVKEVLACKIPNHPGGLGAVLRPLKISNINLDYVYPCIGTGEAPVLILGVSDLGAATEVLEENWITLVGEELYSI